MPRRRNAPKKSEKSQEHAKHKVCNRLVSRILTRAWLHKAFETVCPQLFVYWIAASHINFWNMSRFMDAQLKLCIYNLCTQAVIQTFINTFECDVLVPLHTHTA